MHRYVDRRGWQCSMVRVCWPAMMSAGVRVDEGRPGSCAGDKPTSGHALRDFTARAIKRTDLFTPDSLGLNGRHNAAIYRHRLDLPRTSVRETFRRQNRICVKYSLIFSASCHAHVAP